jgi:hypothetical protein
VKEQSWANTVAARRQCLEEHAPERAPDDNWLAAFDDEMRWFRGDLQ